MKTYLPYYFKKIGLALIIIAIFLSIIANLNSFVEGYIDGAKSAEPNNTELLKIDTEVIKANIAKSLRLTSLLFSFSGLLMYLFSKEKVEDEFIQKLRYKSLAQSFLFTWAVASILFLINGSIKFEGFYLLQFQLFSYIIIYSFKKKNYL